MTTREPLPTRRRSEESRRAILEAAFSILQEDGFEALTIEGVAARAGAGKTTIYRWWSSKGVLAVEAFLKAVTPGIAFHETASARDDMVRQLHALADLYCGPTGRFVREMIGSSQSDAKMAEAFRTGFLEPRRAAARKAYSRGVASGEFRGDLSPDIAMDVVYGSLYYRLIVSGGSIDAEAIEQLASAALQGVTTQVR